MSLGQKDQSICVYPTTRRVLVAATVFRRWQALTEYDGSEGKYVVGFCGGVEKLGLRAKALNQTGHWPVLFDYSNAFNSIQRADVLNEDLHRVPTLTPFVVKCSGGPTYVYV